MYYLAHTGNNGFACFQLPDSQHCFALVLLLVAQPCRIPAFLYMLHSHIPAYSGIPYVAGASLPS